MLKKLCLFLLLYAASAFSSAPLEYQMEPYQMVPFFSGEYQSFVGGSSHFGIYALRQLKTSRESPNYISLGLKGGKIDEALDRVAYFIKREVSLTDNFSFTLKFNHTTYKTYEIGENTLSTILNFQGFFNSTNLFYMSVGAYYRAPVFGKGYNIPFNFFSSQGEEIFFLATMGYKHFMESDDAFSFDINNYNDFHVYNFNNVGFEFSFSSFFSEEWFYVASVEIRTSGLLVGTGMINEERFLFGIGRNF